MKKYISYLAFAFLTCIGISSCIDDDYMETDKGHDTLTLEVSSSAIELDEASYDSDAIELTWTTGTNHGTGNAISYTVEMARSGTNFANAYTVAHDVVQEYTWTATVEELNNILSDEFGVDGGESIELEARVTATVADYDYDQSATVSFTVTGYEPLTTTLYLIGDATPNGWSADQATEMTRTKNGVFTWIGNLTTGEFKFITTLGSFLPSYNSDSEGGLVLRTSDEEADELFTVVTAGTYQVDVNLFNLTMTLTESDGETPAYDRLYFVGDMTGWEFAEMRQDPLDAFLFRYGAVMETAGEFKFGTSDGSWENMYKATYENAPYTETDMEFVSGYSPDYKWVLSSDEINKAYKICVDIRSGEERMIMHEFTPYEMIYLVGDAAPSGWSIDSATAMEATDSEYIFTWTGTLNTGELKFTCDKQSDWNGAWFLAAEADQVPTGATEDMLFIDKSDVDFAAQYLDFSVGDIDQKWQITTAGTYTITLNQLEETITIVLE